MFPVSRYLNIRMAYAPTFTANGRFLTFLTDITGNAEAWQIELAPTIQTPPWPRQLTFNGDRVLFASHSPVYDDNRLLYSSDVGGNEKAQLFLRDPETGQDLCLTQGYETAMHLPGKWSADGRFFLFAANRRHPAYFDLYQQRLDGSPARLVWQNDHPGYLWEQIASPDGQIAIVSRNTSSFQSDLLAIDLTTGQVQQLNPSDQQARYSYVVFSEEGRSLTLLTDLNRDFLYIAQLERESLTWRPLVTAEWDIEKMALSPNGRFIAYVVNRAGNSQLFCLDLESNETQTAPIPHNIPKVIASTMDNLTFSSDSTTVAFSHSSATHAYNIFLWQLDTNKITQVTNTSHAGLPSDSFVAPDLIHYPTFDEREIPAWLYQPANATQAEPLPVIVMVHGGPEGQSRPTFNFLAQYFVQHGYIVLAPNVRGSVGYGKAYSHLDNVEKRMDSVSDLAYAAHWLKKQSHVDPNRITVYGGSYGGFMVLAALTHHPDLWSAGVNIVGISNLTTFLENTSDYRRAHREAEYGSLARDRDFLESIAPINHLDQIQAPLLVIHGANDPRVPLSEAQQLVAALEKRAIPVQLLVFDDEGHGVAKLKNKRVMYPTVIDFLKKQLI